MIYEGISKHVLLRCESLDKEEEFNLDVSLQENFKDVLAYYFEKEYNTPYTETTWLLENSAIEFINELENKWLHNEIDTFALYHDSEFLEFLDKRNLDCVNNDIDDACQDFIRECEFDCRYNLSARDLKDLIDDTFGTLYIEVYVNDVYHEYTHEGIDLEEIYDDEYGDDWEVEEDED